jgi:hypothetical protein
MRSPRFVRDWFVMLYLHDYNAVDYNPAAPEVEIRLGLSEERLDLTLRGLIDSGADATNIPIRYLQQIRVSSLFTNWHLWVLHRCSSRLTISRSSYRARCIESISRDFEPVSKYCRDNAIEDNSC